MTGGSKTVGCGDLSSVSTSCGVGISDGTGTCNSMGSSESIGSNGVASVISSNSWNTNGYWGCGNGNCWGCKNSSNWDGTTSDENTVSMAIGSTGLDCGKTQES